MQKRGVGTDQQSNWTNTSSAIEAATMEPHDTINRIVSQECYSNADVSRLRSLTEDYPNDARLWDVLGDITQLVDGPITDRTASLECYKRSIACDPEYAPAHESLGYGTTSKPNSNWQHNTFNMRSTTAEGILHSSGVPACSNNWGAQTKRDLPWIVAATNRTRRSWICERRLLMGFGHPMQNEGGDG
jgi:hypothetical protein